MIKLIDLLNEGVHDRGVLKCIFTAVGPGSGKSYAIHDVFGLPKGATLTGTGLKVLNQDIAYMAILKKNGIDPKELSNIKRDNPEFYNTTIDTGDKDGPGMLQKAQRISKKLRQFYYMGRLGVIIDGTAAWPPDLEKKKVEAESLGYDTYMLFVNTTLEVALKRNASRDRILPEDIVRDLWQRSQDNLAKYRSMFGNNITIIDNSETRAVDPSVKSEIRRFMEAPIRNPVGREWINTALRIDKMG